jgi:hypothetical protein
MPPDLDVQMKLRRLERGQTIIGRLAIAALAAAIAVGGLMFWYVRIQNALTRTALAQQGWSELMLRSDDAEMGKAKRTLRAFVEQVKRMPDALRERNGMDAFVTKASSRCLALYGYATSVAIAGYTDDCPPKTAKPDDKEKYYSEVDTSRQLIKNFLEKLMLLDQDGLITEPVRQHFMRESMLDFLTFVWLPVEKGVNHVVERDADARDRNAESVRDWYAAQVKRMKDGSPTPDFPPATSFY